MKLQPASRRELKHIAVGTLICSAVMVAVFVLLSVTGIYPSVFWQVLLSALLGSAVAIVNFALLCLTVQSAAEKVWHTTPDQRLARRPAAWQRASR